MKMIDRSTFAQEVGGAQPPGLARAALLFAREIAYPSMSPSSYLMRLDEWGRALSDRLYGRERLAEKVEALSTFLFRDRGMRGNTDDYYDPRNSFLSDVMDRGLGIPITLSTLYIELAARAGLRAEGIGLPGHFVVAVGDDQEHALVDPFHSGRIVGAAEAEQLVERSTGVQQPLRTAWLEPLDERGIIARMLHNLRGAYLQRHDWSQGRATIECLRQLQPEVSEHVRDIGLIALQQGVPGQAAKHLRAYLEIKPTASDSDIIKTLIVAAIDEASRVN